MKEFDRNLKLLRWALMTIASSCWATAPLLAIEITVVVEKIEIEASDAAQLLNPLGKPPSSSEIYASTLDLVDSGNAQVVDTQVLRLRSGQHAETESLREYRYLETEEQRHRTIPLWFPSGVTGGRYLGDGLRLDAIYIQPNGIVQLRLEQKCSGLKGFSHSAQIRWEGWIYSTGVWPVFSLQQTMTQIRVVSGDVSLVSIQSATDESGEPTPERKHILFARIIPR